MGESSSGAVEDERGSWALQGKEAFPGVRQSRHLPEHLPPVEGGRYCPSPLLSQELPVVLGFPSCVP